MDLHNITLQTRFSQLCNFTQFQEILDRQSSELDELRTILKLQCDIIKSQVGII